MTAKAPPAPFRARLIPGAAPEPLRPVVIDLGTWSSAMAMHDTSRAVEDVLDPAQVCKLYQGFRALLETATVRDRAAELLQKVNDRLAAVADSHGGEHFDDLAELRSVVVHAAETITDRELDRDRSRRVALTIAFEELAHENPAAASDLVSHLHDLHDAVYAVPALRLLNLRERNLDDRRVRPEMRSLLNVDLANLTTARLVGDLDDRDGRVTVPALKRYLMLPRDLPELDSAALPQGLPTDTDALLGLSYLDLCRRFEEGTADVGGSPGETPAEARLGARVDEVILTYPTSTPPRARERLRRLAAAALGASDVDLAYDEAAAAALFFLLREFGGDLTGGVPAFRSRAARVSDAPQPTWRTTMLVIDIGGGTTDIAVLAIDLEDHSDLAADGRHGTGDRDQETRMVGHQYVLRPRVLGATGHPQLGGDLITLKIFYWIKTLLADTLQPIVRHRTEAANDPDGHPPNSLTARLLDSASADPAPPDVLAELREFIPTHTAPDGTGTSLGRASGTGPWSIPERTPTFDLLWNWAETRKQDQLCRGRDAALSATDCAGHAHRGGFLGSLAEHPGPIRLAASDFETLLRPVIAEIAGLAADLTRRCLDGHQTPTLDLVALSGRTGSVSVVRDLVVHLLLRELARPEDGRGTKVAWDPTALVDAGEYAKRAAPLGAAWARSRQDFRGPDMDTLRIGRDTVRVQVRNLLLTLPADFGIAGSVGVPLPLLRVGDPLTLCAEDGNYSIRSRWCPATTPVISLHRRMSSAHSIEWGRLLLRRLLPDRTRELPADLWFQIELDTACMPRINLHRGRGLRPRPRLAPIDCKDLASTNTASLRPQLFPALFTADRIHRVPKLLAQALNGDGHPIGVVTDVLAPGTGTDRMDVDLAEDLPNRLPLAGSGIGGTAELPAVVTDRHLPLLPGTELPSERYRLSADAGEGPMLIGDLDTPQTRAADGSPAVQVPTWAVLDGKGRIRLHRGYPVYFPAETLGEALDLPGSVFSMPLKNDVDDLDPGRDPFTGAH